MNADLGFDIGERYSIILLVFFPPYILLELVLLLSGLTAPESCC